jgi:DNA-binding Lrp family transcriptional regulator
MDRADRNRVAMLQETRGGAARPDWWWQARLLQFVERGARTAALEPGRSVTVGGIVMHQSPRQYRMDETDQKLIALLRGDARLTVATLATRLGVSRGTVSNRLRKLEDDRVIVGYTVRLRPDAEPQHIRAWMGVRVDGNQTRAVIANLLGEPGVEALHDTNGRWDLLADLRAGSMADLSRLLERIRLIKGIVTTETSILLATYR